MKGRAAPAWALVAVRALAGAKSRLAPAMSPEARRRLQEAMLVDVLAALAGARALTAVAVVTGDRAAAEIALRNGAAVIDEGAASGLNAALEFGFSALRARGAGPVVVLPADVPLVDPRDVDRAVSLARGGVAVVVADRHRDGTNMLALPADASPAFAFGPGSLARHAAAGPAPVRVLRLASLELDIDTPDDLACLAAARDGAMRTRAALAHDPAPSFERASR